MIGLSSDIAWYTRSYCRHLVPRCLELWTDLEESLQFYLGVILKAFLDLSLDIRGEVDRVDPVIDHLLLQINRCSW